MDFTKVMEQRRSVRAYKNDPVSQESLDRIADAVRRAPTACNRQPFKVFFIRDPAWKAKVAASYKAAWLSQAPVIAVVAGDASQAWIRLEGDSIVDVDCAIVMEHIVLAATNEGLGTCWICAFDRAAADRALELPSPWRTVALTPVGYAAESPEFRERKPLSALVEVL